MKHATCISEKNHKKSFTIEQRQPQILQNVASSIALFRAMVRVKSTLDVRAGSKKPLAHNHVCLFYKTVHLIQIITIT